MREIVPTTFDEVARALAEASSAGQRVSIHGGGTKADWCGATAVADVVLSMTSLNRVVAHRHGDLTATFEAGARLADVNRALVAHRQWLALDPPWADRATIGGIVATNDSGPRRHRFGAPRDQIIGIEIARADGTRAKAGGIVVKNVAGYDLARLMTGSFGSLGAVLSATFKLYPLPAASQTLIVGLPSHAAASAIINAMNASQLTPTAVEIRSHPLQLLLRFESTPLSVGTQSAAACRMAESVGGSVELLQGVREEREWAAHAERPWNGSGSVIKLTLLPSELGPTLDAIAAAGSACVGRAGLGVLLARIDGDAASQARAITALRTRVAPGLGGVVVLRGSKELKALVDPWGPMGDVRRVMHALKASFDPHGTLANGVIQ